MLPLCPRSTVFLSTNNHLLPRSRIRTFLPPYRRGDFNIHSNKHTPCKWVLHDTCCNNLLPNGTIRACRFRTQTSFVTCTLATAKTLAGRFTIFAIDALAALAEVNGTVPAFATLPAEAASAAVTHHRLYPIPFYIFVIQNYPSLANSAAPFPRPI